MKRKVSIGMIVIGLILVFIGGLYNAYGDGIVNQKMLINTPYIKTSAENGANITEDMIGYKEIPESEYEKLKDEIYVYSVDIVGKCITKDVKDGDYFYIKDLIDCKVENTEIDNNN